MTRTRSYIPIYIYTSPLLAPPLDILVPIGFAFVAGTTFTIWWMIAVAKVHPLNPDGEELYHCSECFQYFDDDEQTPHLTHHVRKVTMSDGWVSDQAKKTSTVLVWPRIFKPIEERAA